MPEVDHVTDPNDATIKYPVLSDSMVYKEGEGYERRFVISGWDQRSARRVALLQIRVDRVPDQSFARALIWTDSGWHQMTEVNFSLFWKDMPGFLRWTRNDSDAKTVALAGSLAAKLEGMTEEGNL